MPAIYCACVAVLRFDGEEWRDYLKDGKPVVWLVKEDDLEPGRYRVRD